MSSKTSKLMYLFAHLFLYLQFIYLIVLFNLSIVQYCLSLHSTFINNVYKLCL